MQSNVGAWMVAHLLAPKHELPSEFTTKEYAAFIGKSLTYANKQIRRMLATGEMSNARIQRKRGASTPYYRMVDS